MSRLIAIVPSRGRPHTVAEMAEAFGQTCTADTELRFAVDKSDPEAEEYAEALDSVRDVRASLRVNGTASMVDALNAAAAIAFGHEPPDVLAFLGDDHRPRTKGWDAAYMEALSAKPGLVYGNDLLQGERLPTQVAMSVAVVQALGYMAPPNLTHLYVDNFWLDLGRAADCLTYLPGVIVEHVHPIAGKAAWDAGYARVNDQTMYHRDAAAYAAYWEEHGSLAVAAVRKAVAS